MVSVRGTFRLKRSSFQDYFERLVDVLGFDGGLESHHGTV
jgi:hypothetical protein